MAVENAHVTSFVVEASEYPDLVRKYQVSGVPKTVVNETVEILGARPEEDFVRTAVGAAGPAPAAEGLIP
jgi:predicted DsbA family dithiol-disulfide isomerase